MLDQLDYDFGITKQNRVVFTTGNLVDSFISGDVDHIVHGCNCFCTMGAGLASTVKSRLPEMYQADQQTIKGDMSKLGTFSYHDYGNRFGFNVYTQFNYGRNGVYVDYDAMRAALKAVSDFLEHRCGVDYPQSIGLPMVGCGLAGGSWNKVLPIIKETLSKHTVYVYQL